MNTSINSSENDLTLIRQLIREELRNELQSGQSTPGHNGNSLFGVAESNTLTNRRGMLRKVGMLAAGVAAASMLQPTSARASGRTFGFGSKEGSSPTNSGDPLLIGQANNPTENASGAVRTSLINPNGAGEAQTQTLFLIDNYITNASSLPVGFNTAILAHSDNLNSSTTTDTQCAIFAESRTPGGGFAYGVYGISDRVGVYGEGSGSGCGVDGVVGVGGAVNAFGVHGTSSNGAGGAFVGGRAALTLGQDAGAVADPNASVPVGANGGDLYRGSGNNCVWYHAGNPGDTNPYRRLADSTTAGALSVFAAPPVIINTTTGMGGGLLVAGATAAYQITGVPVNGFTVPAGARSIVARIANPQEAGTSGSILVAATNPPPAGTGIIGLAQSQIQNQGFTSALDATGKLYVRNGTNGSTHIIIAVAGYYL